MQSLQRISGDRLTIIDHLPQELLASAYAAAGVHALPSWMETCGLVSLEAALCGTPLVAVSLAMNSSTSKVMPGLAIQEIPTVFAESWKQHGVLADNIQGP